MFNIIITPDPIDDNKRLDIFLLKINLYGNNLSRVKLQKIN
ncbi:MAG: hypothetical protein U1E31_02570 [Rickettsiales bacterium]